MRLTFDDIDEWAEVRTKERRLIWVFLFFSSMAVTLLIVGVTTAARSKYQASTCALSAAAAIIAILVMLTTTLMLRRRKTAPDLRRPGTLVVRTAAGFWTGMVLFFIFTTIAAGLVMFGDIDFGPQPRNTTRLITGTAPVLALLSVITLAGLATGLVRLPRIAADSNSLSIGAMSGRQTVRWDDIKAIDAALELSNAGIALQLYPSVQPEIQKFLPRPVRPRSRQPITTAVDIFPTGAVPLLLLLRYYLEHPEARDELDDGRAYERLRTITA